MLLLFLLFIICFVSVSSAQDTAFERKVLEKTFAEDAQAWRAEQNSRVFIRDGALCVEAVGGQPILSRSTDEIGGVFRVILRMRTAYASNFQVLWTTKGTPRRDEENSIVIPLNSNGQWNDYEFELPVPDVLTSFAIRFTAEDGVWELKSITVFRTRSHPLSVRRIVPTLHTENGVQEERLRFTITNVSPLSVSFRIPTRETEIHLDPGRSVDLLLPIRPEGNLAAVNLRIEPNDFPTIDHPVFLYRPEGKTDWIRTTLGDERRILEIAPDARLARIRNGEDVVAIIAPLVHRNGIIPSFARKSDAAPGTFEFESPEASLGIDVKDATIRVRITDKVPKSGKEDDETPRLEGPVVRLFGGLRSGLLPGVEFLGPGDVSSSTIDMEEPYQDRSKPNPGWLTAPFGVLATEKTACTLTWNDPTVQPTFSSPNRMDQADDHRISLIGEKIDATLQWSFPEKERENENKEPGTESVLRRVSRTKTPAILAVENFVRDHGLPEPPKAPRGSEDQLKLCAAAIRGPLQGTDGASWSVAVGAASKPYADVLSTLGRLSDVPPKPLFLVSGGSDIANDSIYFLSGRVEEWKEIRERAVRSLLATRSPDGSFLYRTRFPDVESATTSYGLTAIRTLEIMEYVRLTGNRELFALVEKSLEFLLPCDVPRGGFYRDTPMHTPDLLTAATLTWLFAWAYEHDGKPEYLEAARRFAISGIPFVYLWSDRETMLYAAVPKFGATRRRPPFSFSHADPRIGILYAYAVNVLAPLDKTTDWKRLATGILHATESMQYADGPFAGCVPEMFALRNQERRSNKLNPAALVSLRLAVEGKLDSFCVLADKTDRFVAPYPIRWTKAKDGVEAYDVPAGRPFQILRNGTQVGDAQGGGPVRID